MRTYAWVGLFAWLAGAGCCACLVIVTTDKTEAAVFAMMGLIALSNAARHLITVCDR